MDQSNDPRYQKVLKKFEKMPRTEIVSRLKWVKDRKLTYQQAHEAIMATATSTDIPYGKIAEKVAENHGFSNWLTLKCLLMMKHKFEIQIDEIPPYPNRNWKEVATGVVRRKKPNEPTSPS